MWQVWSFYNWKKLIDELKRQTSVPIKIYSTSTIPKKHDLVIVFYIPKNIRYIYSELLNTRTQNLHLIFLIKIEQKR